MYKVIGYKSGKTYLIAKDKRECFRELKRLYPTYRPSKKWVYKGKLNEMIYPEPLKIVKRSR